MTACKRNRFSEHRKKLESKKRSSLEKIAELLQILTAKKKTITAA